MTDVPAGGRFSKEELKELTAPLSRIVITSDGGADAPVDLGLVRLECLVNEVPDGVGPTSERCKGPRSDQP